uniref:Truncated DNA polymerase n=1 Tax=Rhizophagus sp. DAOM 213198 TaxID=1417302 RepID=A0A0A7AMW6_9GLOM|nr:truncated DNA polymerase [Rhizophagus sp. DAOM 213198]
MTSELVNAIKSTPTSTQPTLLSGVNWAPIINGLANVLITNLGGQPVHPSTSPVATKPATQTPGEVQKVSPDLTPIIERMNTLETKLTSLTSQMETMVSSITSMESNLTNGLKEVVNQLTTRL